MSFDRSRDRQERAGGASPVGGRFAGMTAEKKIQLSIELYWAARELTRIERQGNTITVTAPFACPEFTLRFEAPAAAVPQVGKGDAFMNLFEVSDPRKLGAASWCRQGRSMTLCLDLPKGRLRIELGG